MSGREDAEWIRRVFFCSHEMEADREFRETLTRVLRMGLTWVGLVGILGVLVLFLVNWGVLGGGASAIYDIVTARERQRTTTSPTPSALR